MTRRRKLVLLAALLGAVGVVLAVLAITSGGGADRPRTERLDPAAAQAAAMRACAAFDRFERLVEDNASGKKVFAELDEAKEQAERAADSNPKWRSLASGTDALRLGFEEDDAGATRLGADIVRAQCATTR